MTLTAGTMDQAALQFSLPLAAHLWGTRYRRDGGYLTLLNLRPRPDGRRDQNLGSFKFNLATGQWADYAVGITGCGWSDLLGYQHQAGGRDGGAEWLGFILRMTDERPPDCTVDALPAAALQAAGALHSASGLPETPAPDVEVAPVPEPFDEAVFRAVFHHFYRSAPPDRIWAYRNAAGAAACLIFRWNAGTVPWSKGKIIRPFCFSRVRDLPDAEFHGSASFPPRIPILNADKLIRSPGAVCLIVEGEKAADAAAELVPTDWIVSCIAGGLTKRADAVALAGRDVFIWADHDAAGERKAEDTANLARRMGARTVTILRAPPGAPPKWDLADDLGDAGLTRESLTAIFHDAQKVSRSESKAPDLSLIMKIQRSAVSAPVGLMPSWHEDIQTLAKGKGAPADFVIGAMLATASGLTAGALKASPWAGWAEPNPLFLGLVGPSGAAKTPAIEAIVDELDIVEQERWSVYQAEMDAWKLEAQIAKLRKLPAPPKPVPPHLSVSDSTPEALMVLLSRRTVGVLERWLEASAWSNSITRYSQGNATATGNRGFQLEKYDAKATTYSRRSMGDDPLRLRLATSMISAWQPDVVGAFLAGCRASRDGLDARWCFIRPDIELTPGMELCPTEFSRISERVRGAIRRIAELGKAASEDESANRAWTITLTPQAGQVFKDRRWQFLQRKAQESGQNLSGFDAKAFGTALRLALAAKVWEWAAGESGPAAFADAQIGVLEIEAAIEARLGWLAESRRRVEMEAGQPLAELLAENLARWAVLENQHEVDMVELRRRGWVVGIRDDQAALLAVTELAACGWLEPGQILPRDLRREAMPTRIKLSQKVLALARRQLKLDS